MNHSPLHQYCVVKPPLVFACGCHLSSKKCTFILSLIPPPCHGLATKLKVEKIIICCSQHLHNFQFIDSIPCRGKHSSLPKCSLSHKLMVLHEHNFLIFLIFVMFIILTLHRMLHCVLLYIPVDTKHRVGQA